MVAIDVDFDVYKELTVRRRSEDMTENEVIREILGLSKPIIQTKTVMSLSNDSKPWVSKGVVFPHGTEFRATYKGQQFVGTVQNGALVLDGKHFSSPSAAASAITGNPVNGWVFWECLIPGAIKWKAITDLRK